MELAGPAFRQLTEGLSSSSAPELRRSYSEAVRLLDDIYG